MERALAMYNSDEKRCCVAFGRAKEQMTVISGALAQVDQSTTTRVVRDATDGDELKTITLKRPLLHWATWFAEIDCRHSAMPPGFEISSDLEFYALRRGGRHQLGFPNRSRVQA